MTRRPAQFGIRLRIDFGSASSLGPGKIALLEHIGASGSLSQAARDLGMSYRRAWLLLDDLNHAFAEPVTTASIGGAGGGGARLTDFGRKVVAAYRDLEHATDEIARARLAWLAGDSAGAAPHATRRPLTRSLERRASARRRG
jgi:molybdate transport system regulatory protein